jgi:hypothetical protein
VRSAAWAESAPNLAGPRPDGKQWYHGDALGPVRSKNELIAWLNVAGGPAKYKYEVSSMSCMAATRPD